VVHDKRGPSSGVVALSPDGKILASGGYGTTGLWDAVTGERLVALKGHKRGEMQLAFSADGKTLAAAAGLDPDVFLWDVPKGQKRTAVQGPPSEVRQATALAFTADGRTLAIGNDDSAVKLVDVARGKDLATFRPDVGWVHALAFSPDGKLLAAAGSEEFSNHFTPTQYSKCEVKLWDVAAGTERASLKGHTATVNCLAFSPNGKLLASAGGGTIRLWDVASGKERASFNAGAVCLAFSPDGAVLAAGGGSAHSGVVQLWDVPAGRELATFTGHPYVARSVTFTEGGKTLVSADGDRTVKRWNVPPAAKHDE
jgi:WD40 repeat protein